MAAAFIGFGSNIGNRVHNITDALIYLNANDNIRIEKISGLYETQPVGFLDQAAFLNGVVCIETSFRPKELLAICLGVEKKLGRQHSIHWGPRTIDLDILLYDGLVQQTEELVIPHKEIANRRFVLQPLAEIAADVVDPVSGKKVSRLLSETKDKSRVRLVSTSTELSCMIKKV